MSENNTGSSQCNTKSFKLLVCCSVQLGITANTFHLLWSKWKWQQDDDPQRAALSPDSLLTDFLSGFAFCQLPCHSSCSCTQGLRVVQLQQDDTSFDAFVRKEVGCYMRERALQNSSILLQDCCLLLYTMRKKSTSRALQMTSNGLLLHVSDQAVWNRWLWSPLVGPVLTDQPHV